MAYADQGLPPWLQRNISPSEPFDPTPWLQERFRREVIKAKLPLELQQMELANKAMNLQVETQGLQNDLVNQEMNAYATQLPAVRDWMVNEATNPGLTPPPVTSAKAMEMIANRQRISAETTLSKANSRALIAQTEQAAKVADILGITVPRNPDGSFDQERLAALAGEAKKIEMQREIDAKTQVALATRVGTVSSTPEIFEMKDPVTGKPVSLLRTGPNSFRELRGEGEVIEFTTPSGETMRIQRGGRSGSGKSDVPTAMVTKSEEAISGAVNAAKLGSTLINKLRPEDVGILGRGGEILIDEGLAQILPGVSNLERVDSRTLLKFFRADFIRALRSGDSQLSDRDRREIEAMLPSDKSNEALPSALQKIKTATREVAERTRFAAERAKRPLPNELLKPMELIERVQKGEITKEQAAAIAKMSPFRDEFDALIKK